MAIKNLSSLSSIARRAIGVTSSSPVKTSAAASVAKKVATSAAVSAIAIPVVSSLVKSVSTSPTYTKIDEKLGGYLPGGITPGQNTVLDMHGGINRNWSTGTTTMGILNDGNWYAVKKTGQIKVFRPSKNVVFGKKIEPRKFIRIAQKYRVIHKELNSVFKSIKLRRK